MYRLNVQFTQPTDLLTGGIAHSAKRRLFNLFRGRFWVFFAPQGRHVAPMRVKVGRSPPPCQMSPPSVQR